MPLDESPNKFKTERHDLITVDVGDPGAGSYLRWNVPANRVIVVVGIAVELHTTVVVADRWLYPCIQTGGIQTMLISPAMQSQPANTNLTYYLSKGIAPIDLQGAAPGIAMVVGPLSCAMEIKFGESILIAVQNIDVGDTLTDIRIRYWEWMED